MLNTAVKAGEAAETWTAASAASLARAREPQNAHRRSFRWRSDSSGTIIWTDAADRAAVIGRNLSNVEWRERPSPRGPDKWSIRIGGAGACAGSWTFAGEPVFEGPAERFAGFQGKATAGGQPDSGFPASLSADVLRSLAHEIRTPLNAIIGFSEMMSGAMAGVDRALRARVTRIGIDGACIAAAIDAFDESVQVIATEPWLTVTPGILLGMRLQSVAASLPAPQGACINWSCQPDLPAARLSIRAIEYLAREASMLALGYARDGEELDAVLKSEGEGDGTSISIAIKLPMALADVPAEDGEPVGYWPFAPHAGAAFSRDLLEHTAAAVHAQAELNGDSICLRIPVAAFA